MRNKPTPTEPLITSTGDGFQAYEGWVRPKYWLRLRDLPEEEQKPFLHYLQTNRIRCPNDPTEMPEEQDFYQPWHYSEWKNGVVPSPERPQRLIHLPKHMSEDGLTERLHRIKDYRQWAIKHNLSSHTITQDELEASLENAGYDKRHSRVVFPKSKTQES